MTTAIVWTERLLGLAIFFQTLELLRLKSIWSETGVWRWSVIRKGYSNLPARLFRVLDFLLQDKHFYYLLVLRAICSILIWFIHPLWVVTILFFSTWLIAIRWRGIFNGGSDSMTALIALSLWIVRCFELLPLGQVQALIQKACLTYIAVQITLSYFLAGVAKLKHSEWRMGTALAQFFRTPRYDSPPIWIKNLADHAQHSQIISWAVIGFEISFPLAWLNPSVCMVYLMAGFCFHVLNFYIFGLNRFIFAWLAGYPALYFLSTSY